MMWSEHVARELVADRFRTLQEAYSPNPRTVVSRRFRRSRRLAARRPGQARRSLAAGHG